MPPSRFNNNNNSNKGTSNTATQWQLNNNNSNNNNEHNQNFTSEPEPMYTLPGVINYLTSEFTNLERFKIVNNIEKNEMKYKILHLTSEIKSLKHLNEKQEKRIKLLEYENRRLKKESNVDEEASETNQDCTLPDVDLTMIKKSKQQLSNSMKEILQLLKMPSSKIEDLHLNESNDFKSLFNNDCDEFIFDDQTNSSQHSKSLNNSPQKVNEKPTNSNTFISQFFNNDSPNLRPALNDSNLDIDDVLERAITNDSDATTVIVDEQEQELQQNSQHQANITDETFSPEPTISDYKDSDYDTNDIFDQTNYTTYLNSLDDSPVKKITVVSKEDGKELTSQEIDLDIPSGKIINIIPIVINNICDHMLIIDSDNQIRTLNMSSNKVDLLQSLKLQFKLIEAADLIEFEKKNTESSAHKYYGLVINGKSLTQHSFLAKVYQIQYNSSNKIFQIKEIGKYNEKFLTKNHPKFQSIKFAKWIQNSEQPSKPSSSSPSSKKKNDDVYLSPYELMYKIDNETIRLNIISKQISTTP